MSSELSIFQEQLYIQNFYKMPYVLNVSNQLKTTSQKKSRKVLDWRMGGNEMSNSAEQ